jgi:hypothetical protein
MSYLTDAALGHPHTLFSMQRRAPVLPQTNAVVETSPSGVEMLPPEVPSHLSVPEILKGERGFGSITVVVKHIIGEIVGLSLPRASKDGTK